MVRLELFDGAGPNARFIAGGGLRKVGRTAKGVTGTRVTFWPDRQIFLKDAAISRSDLDERARQTSFLVPGLALQITDARSADVSEHRFQHNGGISEFCEFLAADEAITDVIRLRGQDRFTETVPMLDAEGHMEPRDVERDLDMDIAVRWGTGYESTIRSYVNIIATPKGGTHGRRFRTGLTRTFTDVLQRTRLLRRGRDRQGRRPRGDDFSIITVRLAEPQFEGQTKEVLGTPAVTGLVTKAVRRELTAFLTSTKGTTRGQARQVLEKVVGASRARVAARQHRDAQRRKSALESSSLPAKLVDCRSTDVDRLELFIVEGDSALGTAKLARNSEFQALLPIRGKILNVQKASVGDMLRNAECASIIQVVGAGSGRSFDIEAARYGKIIFMADADSDGAHIRCLLATLFFRYMRPLVDAGRVFTAVPPLHRFELTNARKGQQKFIYTYSDAEYQRKAAELTKRGLSFKEPQRYKGLGEMDADQLAETTMSPRHRILRRMTADDGLIAETTFEMPTGNDVGPRKDFIIDGAYRTPRSSTRNPVSDPPLQQSCVDVVIDHPPPPDRRSGGGSSAFRHRGAAYGVGRPRRRIGPRMRRPRSTGGSVRSAPRHRRRPWRSGCAGSP